jgi:hypothetical protein
MNLFVSEPMNRDTPKARTSRPPALVEDDIEGSRPRLSKYSLRRNAFAQFHPREPDRLDLLRLRGSRAGPPVQTEVSVITGRSRENDETLPLRPELDAADPVPSEVEQQRFAEARSLPGVEDPRCIAQPDDQRLLIDQRATEPDQQLACLRGI